MKNPKMLSKIFLDVYTLSDYEFIIMSQILLPYLVIEENFNLPFQFTPVKFDDEIKMLSELKSNLPNNTQRGSILCSINE